MSEEEKKAIADIKEELSISTCCDQIGVGQMKIVLNLIDKQQKAINLMAELLCGMDVVDELGEDSWNWNKEQMKEYFYEKAEEENDSN